MKFISACFTLSAAMFLVGYASFAVAAAPVQVADGVLSNSTGMSLYTFDRDAADKSACNGPCAGNWPPLTAQGYRRL